MSALPPKADMLRGGVNPGGVRDETSCQGRPPDRTPGGGPPLLKRQEECAGCMSAWAAGLVQDQFAQERDCVLPV